MGTGMDPEATLGEPGSKVQSPVSTHHQETSPPSVFAFLPERNKFLPWILEALVLVGKKKTSVLMLTWRRIRGVKKEEEDEEEGGGEDSKERKRMMRKAHY